MNNTQCILDALKIATDTKAFELGEGVLHRAPALFKEYFPNRKAVIVADNNTWKAAGEAVDASMREAGIPCERFLIEEEEFHADWPYVERIDEMLDRTGAVAVAVGSGVINDLCKLASSTTVSPIFAWLRPLRSTVIRRRAQWCRATAPNSISKPMRRW